MKSLLSIALLLVALPCCALEAQRSEPPGGIAEFRFECPAAPEASLELRVLKSWVSENCLFVDLAVRNLGSAAVELPLRNSAVSHFNAQLFDRHGAPRSYCGGVTELTDDFAFDLLDPSETVEVPPGETVHMGSLCVAPFWPYLEEDDEKVTAFRLFYSSDAGTLDGPDSQFERLADSLRQAEPLYCSLARGEFWTERLPLHP